MCAPSSDHTTTMNVWDRILDVIILGRDDHNIKKQHDRS